MTRSRRDFVATGLAGVAGLCATGALGSQAHATPATQRAGPPEDGYRLWLRNAPPGDAAVAAYRGTIRQLVVQGTSPTALIIQREVAAALAALLGSDLPASRQIAGDGAVVIGTPDNSAAIRALSWRGDLAALGNEGYILRAADITGRPVVVIASEGEIGALYGAFHFLRLLQTGQPLERLNVSERPKVQLRLLNHWDNMDGSIERGYAGRSLWQWSDLPGKVDPRYTDYARANASVGINGSVINSVNANALILTPEYLAKVAAIADVWRPYGLRMHLAANVAAPLRVGGLTTADPLDRGVADWWKAKVEEIYRLIPDFGGFTVKANSEGQPGPKDYGRSHAEGANVLADALAPHGGQVIWRAFVYDEDVDPDRAKRAYLEFTRLDGLFRPNVLVQVKNGAIDFQPREPFHPLFGALTKTPVAAEIQATQEYPGTGPAPGVSRPDVGRVPERRHLREGYGLHGGQGHPGGRAAVSRDGNGVGGQPRTRPQLVRPSLLAVELVRLRTPGVEPGAHGPPGRGGVDAHDLLERPPRRGGDHRPDDVVP